jgi:transcriptional regulator with XRE-family HTH domain
MNTEPGEVQQTLTQLVAREIRIELARQGIRQSNLARSMGVTEQWLSVRMRGVQPIDLNDLELIAAGLGVPVSALLPETVQQVLDQEVIKSRPLRSRPTRHTALRKEPTGRYVSRPDRPTDGRPKGRPGKQGPNPQFRRPVRIDSPTAKPSGPLLPPTQPLPR